MDTPNNLVIALHKNKNTFLNARGYLLTIFKEKEKVLQFEKSHIDRTIPYYIQYIESILNPKGITFNDVINHYTYVYPDTDYWELIKISIVHTFTKIENNDFNFEIL